MKRASFDTGPERPKLEGKQADREFRETHTKMKAQKGSQARVTIMEVVVTVGYVGRCPEARRMQHR